MEDVDDIAEIEDAGPGVLEAMIGRLRRSRTEEHFVYRETELDQIWRALGAEIAAQERASGRPATTLRVLRDAVHDVHDLIGLDPAPGKAAARLAQALEAWREGDDDAAS